MPWQIGGTFTRLYSWVADAAAGFDIMADRMDADTNDIAGGLSRARNLDGLNAPANNLPMGGFRHSGVAAATANDHYARYDQVVKVTGDSTVTGNLHVTGEISGDGAIRSTTGFWAGPYASPAAGVNNVGDAFFMGHVDVGGALGVSGTATVGDGLVLTGGNLNINNGTATIAEGLYITGAYPGDALGRSIYCNGGLFALGAIYGDGGLVLDGGNLNINNGDATINQGLYVTGAYSGDSLGRTIFCNGGLYANARIDAQGGLAAAAAIYAHAGLVVDGGNLNVTGGGTATFTQGLYVTGGYPGAPSVALYCAGSAEIDGNLTVTGLLNGHPARAIDDLLARIAALEARVAELEAPGR